MLLSKIKTLTDSLRFKIVWWYLIFSSISLIILYSFAFYTYSQTLISNDRSIILSKLETLKAVYDTGSTNSLIKIINDENIKTSIPNYFVRIVAENEVHFYPMKYADYFERELLEKKSNLLFKNSWNYIKTNNPEDDIELFSTNLDAKTQIQIGKKVDDRDDLLDSFIRIFIYIFASATLASLLLGYIFSNRVIGPIKNLNLLIHKIISGEKNQRIPELNTGDELSELSKQFNIMLDQLEKTQDSMRETLDILSHEMRTPLTRFKTMAEISLAKNQSDSERKESLHELIEGVSDILSEFKLITEITEMENGINNLNLEVIKIDKLISEVLDLYEFSAEEKEIEIVFSPTHLTFKLDKHKVRQAIANIIDNSIKYSPRSTKILITTSIENDQLQIAIKDYGIGIPENEISMIFEKMYRGKNSRNEKGMGLGLSLVNTIVKAHNGKIQITSELNLGTEVKLFFPLN